MRFVATVFASNATWRFAVVVEKGLLIGTILPTEKRIVPLNFYHHNVLPEPVLANVIVFRVSEGNGFAKTS